MIAGLLLAAGAGRRFGDDVVKQLAPFRGAPLVEHPLRALREGGVDEVVVVLGHRADVIEAGAALGGARVVRCEDWAEGQAASLRAGVVAAPAATAVVVVLGDQPLLTGAAVARVVAAHRASPAAPAVRATYAGRPGHPVLLGASLLPAVARLRGDAGARSLLAEVDVLAVACDGLGSAADADTPEALARLEAGAAR